MRRAPQILGEGLKKVCHVFHEQFWFKRVIFFGGKFRFLCFGFCVFVCGLFCGVCVFPWLFRGCFVFSCVFVVCSWCFRCVVVVCFCVWVFFDFLFCLVFVVFVFWFGCFLVVPNVPNFHNVPNATKTSHIFSASA